ncbi:MAG TPA: hypothetical protein VFU04_06460 [Solirubrobacterales bacterium]|nr:hypothetical protein [Solirubrobacterales bacterium]
MHELQAPALHASLDLATAHSRRDQLATGDHPELAVGERGQTPFSLDDLRLRIAPCKG